MNIHDMFIPPEEIRIAINDFSPETDDNNCLETIYNKICNCCIHYNARLNLFEVSRIEAEKTGLNL